MDKDQALEIAIEAIRKERDRWNAYLKNTTAMEDDPVRRHVNWFIEQLNEAQDTLHGLFD